MIFKKKKKEEKIDLDEDDILDFEEFERFEEEAEKKKLDEKEIERTFIFHIENGCPICGQDVKGNEYYKYYCKNCNILFSRKEIVEKEFGKSVRDIAQVKKTRLTKEEQEELQKKRQELTKRVYEKFSEKQKRKLTEDIERVREAIPERQQRETQRPEAMRDAFHGEVREAEYAEENVEAETDETREDEYELEEPDKIIASSQSTKMHSGACHFVKKIHPENRIHLESIEEGEKKGYALCVCLRRIRARS
jgi:hypothetical protein